MKRILLCAFIALTVISCQKKELTPAEIAKAAKENSEKVVKEIIEKDIKVRSMGADLHYKLTTIETLKEVNAGTSKKNLIAELAPTLTIPELLIRVNEKIKIAQASSDIESVKGFTFIKTRFEKLEALKDDKAIDYKVLKHQYSVDNLLNPGTRTDVVEYYYFDGADKLIGFVGNRAYKEFHETSTKTDTQADESIMQKIITDK